MPLYSTIVTREDIARSPAQTLDQVLRQIPGVNLPAVPAYASDPTGNQVRIRGVTNAKVLMMVDGVPVHDPFYSTIQWFKVPLSSVERVEIVRGGSSALWGNLAVAGVINVITRRPADNSFEGSVSYGSLGTRTLALAKNFAVTDAFRLRLSADAFKTDGYNTSQADYLASTFPGKQATAAVSHNFQLAGYFTPSRSFDAFFRIGYHRQDQDIGGYLLGHNLQMSPDGSAGFTKRFDNNSQLQGTAWAQRVTFDKYNGAGCYLNAGARTCATSSTVAGVAPAVVMARPIVQYANSHDWNTYRERGASLVYSTDFQALRSSLQVGVDHRSISGEDDAQTYNTPTNASFLSATLNRTNYGAGAQSFTGVFSQYRVTPPGIDALEVTTNLRADYYTNTDGVAKLTKYTAGVAGATLGGGLPSSSVGSFNPSISARYDISDQWSARGAIYKAFRAPGLNNMFRSFSSTTSITIANPFLKPETLFGREIGTDYRSKSGAYSAGATLYSYDIRDLITSFRVGSVGAAPQAVKDICGNGAFGGAASNCPGTVNYNSNGQNGRFNGLELTARWQVNRAFRLEASHAWTRAYYYRVDTTDPTSIQLAATPRNVTVLGVSWKPTDKWQTHAELRYIGGMYLDIQQTVPQAESKIFNLSTSYEVVKDTHLFAAATNLFNASYSDGSAANASAIAVAPPRMIAAGLRTRF
jgi:iron complex outermembrane receptor protein